MCRALALTTLLLLAEACSSAPTPCGPANCQGCCGADGVCRSTPSTAECGLRGVTCVSCGATAACVEGACQELDGGTGGGGGAMDPCDVDNGGCDAVATCTPSGATRTCACPSGSSGDGLTCTPQLSSLTVTPASLAPLFAPVVTSYVASVPYSQSQITVTAATMAPGASILIDGQPMTTRMIPLSAPTRPVAVTVRFDATQRSASYSVLLSRARRTVQQGYLKAETPSRDDSFGAAVAMSRDGNTLVVGAPFDDGPGDNVLNGGAAFVFLRIAGTWTFVMALRASNAGADDNFGTSVAISADGAVIAVGAPREDSDGTGGGNDARPDSGAVYVFTRSGGVWTETALVKAAEVDEGDGFGGSVALSGDGQVLAVGGPDEDSASTGVNADATDDSATSAGAAWVLTAAGATWGQTAYLKASNSDAQDRFGAAVALNDDGTALAVGATGEASNARTIDGAPDDDSAPNAGAVYVFRRGANWAQEIRLKASNAGAGDVFGASVSLSGDGQRVAVGAWGEDSGRVGINGPDDDAADLSGAAYVFSREAGAWKEDARIKATNVDPGDRFGQAVSLSRDGAALLVGAQAEASNASGLDGDQSMNNVLTAGAAYLFGRTSAGWAQEVYVKASNPGVADTFGRSVALSGDGVSFACGAPGESSASSGVNGNQADDSAAGAGAVYAFTRLPL
ncbi:MAG: cadherin-like beta sandwich domain-containing protein [Myxococcota bacterium]